MREVWKEGMQMIVVKHQNNTISITGHANFAPMGKDIVCASISTLIQVFIASVEELTNDELKAEITSGNAVIQYGDLSEKAQTLLSSFLLGVGMIASEYPNNVRIDQAFKS